jgi:hypothetical protein
MSSKINYLKQHQIDRNKWDQVIENSPDQLIYGYSWFLDEVSPGWEGLIYGDYDAVMPLPVKRLAGFKMILQPLLAQQLGLFSTIPVTAELTRKFIEAVPITIITYHFHKGHQKVQGFDIKTNFQLSLDKPYEILEKKYSQNTRRNLSKTIKNQLIIDKKIPITTFLDFHQNNYGDGLSKNDYRRLRSIAIKASGKSHTLVYSCLNPAGNTQAMVLFLKFKKRIVYYFAISTTEGYKNSAMFRIVDEIVRDYAEMDMIIDFEGSENDGIARFYKGFGAENVPYYSYENHRVLKALKWLISIKRKLK